MRRAALLVTLLLPWAALADPPRQAVEARLAGYERTFSEQDMKALGPGADRVLIQIVDDAKAADLLRARAVSALAYARTADARKRLEGLLQPKAAGEGVERLLQRKAAIALGWQAGPAAVGLLVPLLYHRDEEVRLDATLGLGLTRSAAAAEQLRSRMAEEPSASVRYQLGKQVKVIENALAAAEPTTKTR